MDKEKIVERLNYFLDSDEEIIVALKGVWGVGKTYLWKELTESRYAENKFHYYISLFGVSDIKDIKQQISLSYLRKNNMDSPNKVINSKWTERLANLFKNSKYVFAMDILNEIASDTLNGDILCFDDLERAGDGFSLDSFGGFLAELKNTKKCRILLIFNEKELKKEKINSFGPFKEKLVDYELLFSPSSDESCEVVFKGAPRDNKIREYCISLNITNIRTLQKIRKKCIDLEKILLNKGVVIKDFMLHSMVLNVWAYNEDPDLFNFLENYTVYERIKVLPKSEGKETQEEKEKNTWRVILDNYNYTQTDDMDQSIRSFIRDTDINESSVARMIEVISNSVKNNEMAEEYREVWAVFHNSFKHDENYLVEKVQILFKKNVAALTLVDLDGAVKICSMFEKSEIADQLISAFIHEHGRNSEMFDIRKSEYFSVNFEEKVLSMCKEYFSRNQPKPTVKGIIEQLDNGERITEEMEKAFSEFSEEELFSTLMDIESNNLNKVIVNLFTAADFADKGSDNKTNEVKMINVIDRIGNTNRLNAERVKRYR